MGRGAEGSVRVGMRTQHDTRAIPCTHFAEVVFRIPLRRPMSLVEAGPLGFVRFVESFESFDAKRATPSRRRLHMLGGIHVSRRPPISLIVGRSCTRASRSACPLSGEAGCLRAWPSVRPCVRACLRACVRLRPS